MKNGKLSINSENIFPIIKKWLYSDHDIFARELISNASDAITKVQKLSTLGEYTLPANEEYRIYVVKDRENNLLRFIDNGIGMTAAEVEKYINDIAFSGATDFLNAYKDKTDSDQIIGHFGLGFYSAFMVASAVEIDTKSYKRDEAAVHWKNDGGIDFSMEESERMARGTEITLHISEDSKQFLEDKLDMTIQKYCSYMPYPIFIMDAKEFDALEHPFVLDGESDTKRSPINDTTPLYLKSPASVSDEEYKEFYKKAFFDFKDPIFWIHLNMDYPFNLKGIIYFPRAKNEYEFAEGHIKLYNSQVFVADNVNEVVPEFLTVLSGVIDCPDLPLNVSRSALQNDGFVRKISDYIGKKVADKLRAVSTKDRKVYEDSWKDIGPFIEFGVIRDEKFSEQMKDNLLFQFTDGQFATLDELKEENPIYYTTDVMRQAQYIEAQLSEGRRVVILKHKIEQALISHLEMSDENLKFKRVDSIEGDEEALPSGIDALFGASVSATEMKDTGICAMYVQSEQARRSAEFAKLYGFNFGDDKEKERKLVINKNNPIIIKLLSLLSESGKNPQNEDEHKAETPAEKSVAVSEEARLVANYIESLARISSDEFSKEEMKEFTRLSNEVLGKVLLS